MLFPLLFLCNIYQHGGIMENTKGLVVTIGSNTMGAGDEGLGAILIKSFIYSLTELKTPPRAVLFFNSGVKLAAAGSNCIEDLKKLEAAGTTVASCGTCVDFFKLKDSMSAGAITGMPIIVQTMADAEKVINI